MPRIENGRKIVEFYQLRTDDGTGIYFAPRIPNVFQLGSADLTTVHLLDKMGYPPDTDGWIESQPIDRAGWYDVETIGNIVFDLTEKGYEVRFRKVN
jgi:hypothetical protein